MTLAWCGLHRIHLSEFLLQDALRTVLASGWTAPFSWQLTWFSFVHFRHKRLRVLGT